MRSYPDLSTRRVLKSRGTLQTFWLVTPERFSADEIVGRMDVTANALMAESFLSHHEIFSYGKKGAKLYWYIEDGNLEDASEVANKEDNFPNFNICES